MRVAAIYDVHGNLPALEAVLEDVRQAEAELVVVGGDIVPGPMPRETLACLLNIHIPVRFIQGNGEIDALSEMAGSGAIRVPEQYREVVKWSAQQLYPEYQHLLAAWSKTIRVQITDLGGVLFCHATPRDDNEIFTRLTPAERLIPIFEGINESIIVCGHTHMQFDRIIEGHRVINAGSVGMPFGHTGADWLLLGPDVQFRHTSYDLASAADRIQKTRYPQVRDFVANCLFKPPSVETMLQAYARAELK